MLKCQISDPYVNSGILRGSVCPWEIGAADTYGLTILEDFHDTLEAMWVWCYCTKTSRKNTYVQNIEMGWNYIENNFKRFIPPDDHREGLMDCAQVVLCGSLYEETFADDHYRRLIELQETDLHAIASRSGLHIRATQIGC